MRRRRTGSAAAATALAAGAGSLSPRRIATGAGAKLLTEVVARLASFGVVLWAARELGPADFGLYLYGLGIGFLLAQGADLGLHLLIAREVATRGRAARPLLRSALRIKLALAGAATLLLAALTWGHPTSVQAALLALGAALVVNGFIEFAGHVFRGNQELQREVRLLTGARLFAAGAVAVLLWLGGDLLALSLVTLGAALAGCAAALWMLRREGWLGGSDEPLVPGDRPPLRAGELLREAVPLGLAIVFSVAYLRVGWLLLFPLAGEEAVAQLGVAQRLMEVAQLVPAAILAAVFPVYASTFRTNPPAARRLTRGSAAVLGMLGLAAAGALLGAAEWLVPALFGPAYAAAIPVLCVLALALPAMFLNYLFTHVLIARGAQGLVAWFGGSVLVVHVVVSWNLIPGWGAMGVAASMVLVEAALLACCVMALRATRDAPGERHAPHLPLRTGRGRLAAGARRTGLGALVVLAATLPFELEVWRVPGGLLTVSTVEGLVAVVVVAALVALLAGEGAIRSWCRALPPVGSVLLVALLGALFLSAALAPEFQGNALRAAARSAMGVALAAAVVALAHGRRDRQIVGAAAVVGGLVAVVPGLWELAQGAASPVLELFRGQVTRLGPFLRLTASFDHANQASMYLEATAPLLVALVAVAWQRGRRLLAIFGALVLAVYLQAAILTYSRAGIVTLVASLLVVAFLGWRRRGSRSVGPWFGAALLTLLLFAGTAVADPTTRVRFGHGSPEQWYAIELRAPVALEVRSGAAHDVPLEVVNLGALVWQPEGRQRVQLVARWFDEGTDVTVSEQRWPLPGVVAPGDTVRIAVPLRTPAQPGPYGVQWDLVHEQVTWFSGATGRRFVTRAVVAAGGAVVAMDTGHLAVGAVEELELAPMAPGRAALWRVAVAELSRHPWTGVGLDNFRLRYGRGLGWESWNETIHANNWYLEMLVAGGVVGGLLFLVLAGILALDLFRVLSAGRPDTFTVAVGAGLLAFLIHGTLDYFLLFHATGLLFWLLIGTWVARRRTVEADP